MRVLVVAAPLLGHVFPLMPLALELRAAGHDVLVATGGEALRVRDSGLDVEDVTPPNVRIGRIAARIMLTHPVVAMRELRGAGGMAFVSRMFSTVADAMYPQLQALANRWQPDVVLHEPLATAGSALGVPSIVQDVSLFDGRTLTNAVAARMTAEVRSPATILRTAPPSVASFPGRPMRFVPYSGQGPVPRWLAEPPDRPRVLVSRSTVGGPGVGKMMAAVVAAAPHVDAEFVLLRPGKLTGLPDNVRTVDWVPIPHVLPFCTAIVHHGGAGTLLASLAAGVPQLVEPGPGDRTVHADAITSHGAGLRASAREVVVPDVLQRLITDEKLKTAAGEVRDEMAAMPSPADVAAQWDSLRSAEIE